jgi:hypothetical protein
LSVIEGVGSTFGLLAELVAPFENAGSSALLHHE